MSAEIDPHLVDQVDACLPQTQCQRCGYPGCREYAAAIAGGEADINRCPPGDPVTRKMLANLLQRELPPLDPEVGLHQPRPLAYIDESRCIGCTICIRACPVDAIIGAAKVMHAILETQCTGCELCLEPCPMDCIHLRPANIVVDPDSQWTEYSRSDTKNARRRRQAHINRIDSDRQAEQQALEKKRIREDIAAAVARVRARKSEKKK
jgi:electron transport complex protein RnfB